MDRILYLTSELVNRDWDARLMMADYAVATGFSVVLGQQWAILNNLDVIPRGLALVKTMNAIQGEAMRAFRKAGHLVAAMDEEALPLATDREEAIHHISRGYSPAAIASCDVFFANSPLHRKAIEAGVPGLAAKVEVVGNTRMDILTAKRRVRYAAEAEALRQKHGPFILFNSNTASRNSIWSREQFLQIQVRSGALDPNNPQSIAIFNEQMEFEERNARIFEDLLRWCAGNLRSHRIVVRPHPSEGLEYWDKFQAENPTVHVAWATPHIPWMLASDLVVHTNCTTGIEAAALDKPVLNLMTMPDAFWSRLYFAAAVCPSIGDLESAAGAVKRHFETSARPLMPDAGQRSEMQRYFPCIAEARSAEILVEKMTQLVLHRGGASGKAPGPGAFRDQYRMVQHEGTLKKKFSKTAEAAVEGFKATRLATGLTHPVRFDQIDDSLFLLRPV